MISLTDQNFLKYETFLNKKSNLCSFHFLHDFILLLINILLNISQNDIKDPLKSWPNFYIQILDDFELLGNNKKYDKRQISIVTLNQILNEIGVEM